MFGTLPLMEVVSIWADAGADPVGVRPWRALHLQLDTVSVDSLVASRAGNWLRSDRGLNWVGGDWGPVRRGLIDHSGRCGGSCSRGRVGRYDAFVCLQRSAMAPDVAETDFTDALVAVVKSIGGTGSGLPRLRHQ